MGGTIVGVVTALAVHAEDPRTALPGAWYLVGVFLATALGGWLAGTATAVAGTVLFWYSPTEPHNEFAVPATLGQGLALAGFVLLAAVVVAVEVRQAATTRRLARANTRARVLQTITEELSAALEPQAVGEIVGRRVVDAMGADAVTLGLVSDDGERVEWLAMVGYPPAVVAPYTSLPLDQPSTVSDAVRSGEPVVIRNLEEHHRRYPHLRGQADVVGAHCWVRWPLKLGEDTIGVLGVLWRTPQALRPDELAFVGTVAELFAQALVRTRAYADEHAIAHVLQRAVLPSAEPTVGGLRVGARYEPATTTAGIVGGDWYDALPLPKGAVFLAVGDVVGHGVAAAEDMTQLRSAARAFAVAGYPPARMLTDLSEFVATATRGQFATMVVVVFDPATMTARYSTAGHPPPVVRRGDGGGGVTVLAGTGGPPLGVQVEPIVRYEEATVELRAGDTLVLYTDGLVERRGEPIDAGVGRLVAALRELGRTDDLVDLCARVVERCVVGTTPTDDICLLAASPARPGDATPGA